MIVEAVPTLFYHNYRVRMASLLHIPLAASDHDIHERIELGFPASVMKGLVDLGAIDLITRNRILPYRTFKRRLADDQRLTRNESNRLFQVVHVTAMAEALFGDSEKAKRWLTKPKRFLSGKSPGDLVFTTPGAHQVEQMLVRIGEGFSF